MIVIKDEEAEMKRDEMGGVFRTRQREEKFLLGKAEQMRQLRKYTRRREEKLKVKSVRQE
jgi:hypothetical protein